jgi:acetyl-CoA carboxylase carboxyltransferase component
MERIRTSAVVLLFALAGWLPVSAQERHVADQATLDQAIADHVRQRADDREAIRRVLEMDQVRKLGEGVGLDVTRAETAVATLDDTEVGVIAAQARVVNEALAGGQSSVTISTTAIIIGLLVLILLIVAI